MENSPLALEKGKSVKNGHSGTTKFSPMQVPLQDRACHGPRRPKNLHADTGQTIQHKFTPSIKPQQNLYKTVTLLDFP